MVHAANRKMRSPEIARYSDSYHHWNGDSPGRVWCGEGGREEKYGSKMGKIYDSARKLL